MMNQYDRFMRARTRTRISLFDIKCFEQYGWETLEDAWSRMKKMLEDCEGHGLERDTYIPIFYGGLKYFTQESLDIACGRPFLYNSANQAYDFLEGISQTQFGESPNIEDHDSPDLEDQNSQTSQEEHQEIQETGPLDALLDDTQFDMRLNPPTFEPYQTGDEYENDVAHIDVTTTCYSTDEEHEFEIITESEVETIQTKPTLVVSIVSGVSSIMQACNKLVSKKRKLEEASATFLNNKSIFQDQISPDKPVLRGADKKQRGEILELTTGGHPVSDWVMSMVKFEYVSPFKFRPPDTSGAGNFETPPW